MYLNRLCEKSKFYFLELAYYLTLVDGKLSYEEKELLEYYKIECSLMDYSFESKPLKEIEFYFINRNNLEKNIVLFELIGLSYIDGCYSDSEKKLIEQLRNSFNIKLEVLEVFEQKIEELTKIYNNLENIMVI